MDSFKGSLTSAEAEAAVAEGLRVVFPGCELCSVPCSDGGEGMMEAFVTAAGGSFVSVPTHDPLMRQRHARYGVVGGKVVIEAAEAAGLALLEPSERNPLLTSTYGVGEMIASALAEGCRHFVVGIGGSATNDAGLGMMEALGARFYASDGSLLSPCGGNLSRIARIDLGGLMPELSSASFMVACDVRNVFYGPDGAARVYAPQKGASLEQVEILDAGMRHVASLIRSLVGIDLSSVLGSGAAGGLGGALFAFLGARLCLGVEVFTAVAGLEEKIASSDLVITGEGKADRQTLMGKLPYGILRVASSLGERSARAGKLPYAEEQSICDGSLLDVEEGSRCEGELSLAGEGSKCGGELPYTNEQTFGKAEQRGRKRPVVLIAGLVEDRSALLSAGFSAVLQSAPSSQPLSVCLLPSVARQNLTATILANDKILRELPK